MWKPGEHVFESEFTIRALAGSGGCADVYRAHWRHGGHDVALKVPARFRLAETSPGVFETRTEDQELVKQVLNECRMWARCPRHPLLTEFRTFRNKGSVVALVTEWVDGITLEAAVQDRFSELWSHPGTRAAKIGLDILDALALIHKAGVMHLDLTPRNILLSHDLKKLKVTDFGLSSHRSDGRTSPWGWSPGFAAPEVLRGEQPSAKADLFSWGMMMLFLAGQRHAPTRSLGMVSDEDLQRMCGDATEVHQQLRGRTSNAERRFNTFEPALWSLVLECVAPDAGDRPEAAVAAERLRDILHKRTGRVPPRPSAARPPDQELVEAFDGIERGEMAGIELAVALSKGRATGILVPDASGVPWIAHKLNLHADLKNHAGLREHFAVLERICRDLTKTAHKAQWEPLLLAALLSLVEKARKRNESRLLDTIREMLKPEGQASVALSEEAIQRVLDRVVEAEIAMRQVALSPLSRETPCDDDVFVIEDPKHIEQILCQALRDPCDPKCRSALRRGARAVEQLKASVACGRGSPQPVKDLLDNLSTAIAGAESGRTYLEATRRDVGDAEEVKGAVRGLGRLITRSIDPTDSASRSRVWSRCRDLQRAILSSDPPHQP